MAKKYIPMKAVQQMLGGRSRTSIYADVERGELPPPIKLGGTLFWAESEVDEHLQSLKTDVSE